MTYRCKVQFKSFSGKNYSIGDVISFDEYYQLAENERKNFLFTQNNSVRKEKLDRIR